MEPTKKILFVITKSNWGGAQRYVFELAAALQKRDYQVAIASGGTTGELIDRAHECGITHFPIKHFQRDINCYKELRAALELAQIIRRFDPDIIHLNSSKAGGTGAFIARLLGVPRIIFTAHGWVHNEDRSRLWRLAARIASWLTGTLTHGVITVSEYDRNTAPSKRIKRKSITIHPAIASLQFLDPSAAQTALGITTTHTRSVVSIAELTPNKNLNFAITAIANYNQMHQDQPISYYIIGDGELHTSLQNQITQLGMTQHIHLLGYQKDAYRFLRAFDIFLLPSKKEGFPYALLEAHAAGLPIVASRVGGIPEFVTPAVGTLIEVNNEAQLHTALATTTTNTDLTPTDNHYQMVEQTITLYNAP